MWAVLLAVLTMHCAPLAALGSDARILDAREALRKGDRQRLEVLAATRDGHVLDVYVRYWMLLSHIAQPEKPDAREIEGFLAAEQGSLLAERLRAGWLRRMARDEDWAAYRLQFDEALDPDQDLICHGWNARLHSGDPSALEEAAVHWSELDDAPDACEPVLQALVSRGRVEADEVWWRLRRQIEGRSPKSARVTVGWLPGGEAPAYGQIERLLASPGKFLDHLPANFSATRAGRELAMAALVRVMRDDARAGYARMMRIDDRFKAEERAYLFAVLGFEAAKEQLPEAAEWYRAAGAVRLTPEQQAWRVRAALRAGDWKLVTSSIEAMPEGERSQPQWTYWLARAHAQTGDAEAARILYTLVADSPDFYGLLAAEELGRPFSIKPGAPAVAADDAAAEADPGLSRALALYRLDMRAEAVREWNWALRDRDEAFLIGAARLALKNGQYDRAIFAAERAGRNDHFDLRYLAPYRELIEPQARGQGLDMGWVYGLMRQESRFVQVARSGAGAQGLMQVMPRTGRWVAKKMGLSGYHSGWLQDPESNVMLGTNYMRMVMEGLDNHPVLASAGYNAGPSRAKRWQAEQPLEGAIYVETIPFDETRDYVKKVMANAVIYAALFEDRPQSLKARLGVVAPR
jgi:soluble lytic murein transglycosylase